MHILIFVSCPCVPSSVLRHSCICLQNGPLWVFCTLWMPAFGCHTAFLMLKLFLADVDECMNGTVCGSHGFCENMDGSYRCLCYQGYQDTQDGQGCTGEFMGADGHCCKVQGSENSIPTKCISHFCFLWLFIKVTPLTSKIGLSNSLNFVQDGNFTLYLLN